MAMRVLILLLGAGVTSVAGDAEALVQTAVSAGVHSSSSVEAQMTARLGAVARLESTGQLVAAEGDGVWVHSAESANKTNKTKKLIQYGFYLHTFDKPEACINLLRSVRKFYPHEPIYIMSDGGMNFTGLCKSLTNCNFQWRPPANDRWNPQPFFNRISEAANWLDTEFLVMLEPDNEIRGKIAQTPPEDAGGLRDSNPPFGKNLLEFISKKGEPYGHHKNFSIEWNRFGLAGGSYFKTQAIKDSFKPHDVDWKSLRQWVGKKIWSSDVAMPMALATHGYIYKPWKEVTQTRSEDFWGKPTNHPAFRHYGRDEIKPSYDKGLTKESASLVTNTPANTGNVACQGCVWVDDAECWKRSPVQCPITKHDGGPPF